MRYHTMSVVAHPGVGPVMWVVRTLDVGHRGRGTRLHGGNRRPPGHGRRRRRGRAPNHARGAVQVRPAIAVIGTVAIGRLAGCKAGGEDGWDLSVLEQKIKV